jgi:hypothetical protein
MAVQLVQLPDGRWQVACDHCGATLATTTDREGADRILDCLGVPPIPGTEPPGPRRDPGPGGPPLVTRPHDWPPDKP